MPSNEHDINIDKDVAAIVYETNQGNAVIRINPEWLTDLSGRTQPYKNFPYKLKPALEKVADYVRIEMIPRTFTSEGPGWRRLSRRTQRERKAEGYGAAHPILIRTRDLFKELTTKSHPKHIEVIKTGKYARIVVGGSSEKYVRNQLGSQEFRIPSRPMIPGTGSLPLPDRDKKAIRDILVNSIKQEMSK